MSDDELKPLYQWVDEIPLSRPKRNIARDFADGGARRGDQHENTRQEPLSCFIVLFYFFLYFFPFDARPSRHAHRRSDPGLHPPRPHPSLALATQSWWRRRSRTSTRGWWSSTTTAAPTA